MKHLKLLLIVLLFIFPITAFAAPGIKVLTQEESQAKNKEISRSDALSLFALYYKDQVPSSVQYIHLNFKDVLETSDLYKDLQVLVYFDLIKNSQSSLHPNKGIDIYSFSTLAKNILGVSVSSDLEKSELKKIPAKQKDIDTIKKIIETRYQELNLEKEDTNFADKIEIFQDVYKTLMEQHYERENLDPDEIIYSAIEGLAEGTKDEYTTYFPPTDSKDFQENINGEYEGIGSYVEMPEPGKLIIIAPIVSSPSEKAGIKGGDIVTHVNGDQITENISLREAVSWIKGPKGTAVTLTILRNGKTLDIDVVREKIIIKDIEYKYLKYNTLYIQIRNFGPNVSKDFSTLVEELSKNKQIKKVVIDVRNNPGGYLGQVSKILSHFVPVNEATAIVDYGDSEEIYRSRGYTTVDFSEYDIRLLQNGGSASASEILVGTIKDYYPEAIIIGEKSFGKGSVQSIKDYSDGSSLKVTIAKWFTGKTRKGIDKVGIEPDIFVELDEISFEKGYDIQLETALKK